MLVKVRVEKELLCTLFGNVNLDNHYQKQYGFFKKLKMELLYNLVILPLGKCPKECISGYNRDTCAPMFIAA
jgi:hypothetical protein